MLVNDTRDEKLGSLFRGDLFRIARPQFEYEEHLMMMIDPTDKRRPMSSLVLDLVTKKEIRLNKWFDVKKEILRHDV